MSPLKAEFSTVLAEEGVRDLKLGKDLTPDHCSEDGGDHTARNVIRPSELNVTPGRHSASKQGLQSYFSERN